MPRKKTRATPQMAPAGETTLRIVGGRWRGRKLKYAGDPRVRPMKDRVREALFNLLGPDVRGTFAIDLFGGTGALVLEALSRGASGGLVVEQHLPTARVLRENLAALEATNQVRLVTANTFHWFRSNPDLPPQPRTVFCSPPYRMFVDRTDDLLQLIGGLMVPAPAGSLVAVEATEAFDFGLLPQPELWDVRSYPPAVVGVARLP